MTTKTAPKRNTMEARILKLADDGELSKAAIAEECDVNIRAVWKVMAHHGRTNSSKESVARADANYDRFLETLGKVSGKAPVKKAAPAKATAKPKRNVRTTKVTPKAVKKVRNTGDVKKVLAATA